jgi:hypothetical protein
MATLTTPSFTTTIGVGAATPSASGAGITFPATQSASTNANTLDDYEEGTFTPVMRGTTSGTLNLSGAYTKIGNTVQVNIYYANPIAAGTIVGNVYITGLPFAPFMGGGAFPGQSGTGLLHIRGNASGTAGAPFAVLSGTQVNLHTSANLGTTTVTGSATATFPATNISQNGTTTIQIGWTFVYLV